MNILSKFQLPSPSGLELTVFGRYLNKRISESMNQSVNQWRRWLSNIHSYTGSVYYLGRGKLYVMTKLRVFFLSFKIKKLNQTSSQWFVTLASKGRCYFSRPIYLLMFMNILSLWIFYHLIIKRFRIIYDLKRKLNSWHNL